MGLSRTPLSQQCLSVLCLMTIDVHPTTLQDRFPHFPPFFFPVFLPSLTLGTVRSAATISRLPSLLLTHRNSQVFSRPGGAAPDYLPLEPEVLNSGKGGRREDRGLSRNDRPFTLMHPIKTGARNQIKPRVELEGGKNDPTALSKLDVTNESRSVARTAPDHRQCPFKVRIGGDPNPFLAREGVWNPINGATSACPSHCHHRMCHF